jgi:hypothetical protein
MIDEEIAHREAAVKKLGAIDRRLASLATLADRSDELEAAAKDHPELEDLVEEIDDYIAEVMEYSRLEAEVIAAAAGAAMPSNE